MITAVRIQLLGALVLHSSALAHTMHNFCCFLIVNFQASYASNDLRQECLLNLSPNNPSMAIELCGIRRKQQIYIFYVLFSFVSVSTSIVTVDAQRYPPILLLVKHNMCFDPRIFYTPVTQECFWFFIWCISFH